MSVSVWVLKFDDVKYDLSYLGKSVNLDEASGKLQQGVYTTFRTYQHSKVLRFEEHINRLESSAALQGKQLSLNRLILKNAIKEVLQVFSGTDARIRIHCAYAAENFQHYLMGEAFLPYPEEMYKNGVSVKSMKLHRENPVSKATSFITQTKEIRSGKPREIHEYIMFDENNGILEGFTSNIFIVRDGIIWTAEEGVLPGITRKIMLDAVTYAGIAVKLQCYPIDEIPCAEEVFITSASRGVMPVTEFDGKMIGSGKPGNLTLRIRSLFEEKLAGELQDL